MQGGFPARRMHALNSGPGGYIKKHIYVFNQFFGGCGYLA